MATDFLELVQLDVPLRRVASTHGGEYAGPCPSCGGRDRFRVWGARRRYWCRQCGKKGDTIQYLRDFRGLSFTEAKRALGMDLSPPSRQARTRMIAHRLALAAAREGYESWQRKRLVALTDEYRDLVAECETAEIGFRAAHRRPDLYNEDDQFYWIQRLATLYDRLAVLEHDLNVLTYRSQEAEQFSWWQGEEKRGQLAA